MNRQTEESAPAQPPRHVFRALHHRNYRLFFFGQGVSVIGTWMQRVALSWLVYVLTGDPFLLGVVNFSNQIPAALVAPFAGVLADRMDRRRLLIATQSLAMAQAFVLAALTLLGQVAIWHIILLGVVLGLVNGLDMPIRQSFVVNMVGRREDLPNAIALNSFIFNAAMLLGPSLGGLVLHYLNAGICFLINGISFAAVLAALVAMRVEPTARPPTDKHVLIHLKEGLTYALGSPPIRAVLTLLIMISLLGRPYGVLLPIFAKDILAGDARTYGFLLAATGVGAIGGAILLASRQSVRGLELLNPLATTLFGLSLVAFAFSRNLALSLGVLLVGGFGQMVQTASSNTLLQTVVDDDKRGRVMSLYSMCLQGLLPLGNLLAGALAKWLGAPWTVFLSGFGCFAAAGIFARNRHVLRRTLEPTAAVGGEAPGPLPASGNGSTTPL
jgi:MFS family permease